MTYLIGLSVMQAGLFLITVSTNPVRVAFLYSLTAAGFSIFVGVFYPLVQRFIGCKSRTVVSILSLVSTAVALAASFSGIFYRGFYMGSGGFFVPYLRYSAVPLIIPVFCFWILGLIILPRQFAKTDSLFQKNKLMYPIIGSIAVVFGGLLNLTPLKEFPFDVLFYLLNAVLFGYAIIKHLVVDVKTALRRGVIISAFVLGLLVTNYLITRIAEHFLSEYFSFATLGFFSLLIIILMVSIIARKKIGPVLTGLFFKEAAARQTFLDQYSRVVLTAVHPQTVFKELEKTLNGAYKIEFLHIYIKNERKSGFTLVYCSESNNENYPPDLLREDHKLFQVLKKEGGPIWIEELKMKQERSNVIEICNIFYPDIVPEIIFPIYEAGRLNGIMCFREKSRDRIYVQEDLMFFTILANLTSTALLKAGVFEDLEKSLKEKELLLKEVHHRVKNNLQLISSMLQLQKNEIENDEIADLFSITQNRINSIAHVHESIYISDSLSRINSKDYIKALISGIRFQYGEESSVKVTLDLEDFFLNINQAVPLGLIINELITNAFKHAFTVTRAGELTARSRCVDGMVECRIKDNGPGFKKPHELQSLGLVIVETLINDQLEGEWAVNSGAGTEHIISFPSSTE